MGNDYYDEFNQEPDSDNEGVAIFAMGYIILIGLRICGVIDWSWWIITAPLYAPFIIAFVAIIIIIICEHHFFDK